MAAMELNALLASDAALPSIPKVVALLVNELNKPDPDLRKISQLISTDPGLTARILRLANSPNFRLARKISSVAEALAILGFDDLHALGQAATQGTALRAVAGVPMQQFWRYSLNVAKLARSYAGQVRLNQATAFTSGLIHAVGELVMHLAMPAAMARLSETVGPLELKRARAEQKALGYTYAEVSAGFALQWQYPDSIVDAPQHQVKPFDNEVYEPLAGLLHLAAWRARAHEAGLTERELAVTFPGEVGLILGLDIDMVLQQQAIDWNSRSDAGDEE